MSVSLAFEPDHDETSRQNFAAALKGYVNFDLEARLARLYAERLAPGHAERHGAAPADRTEAAAVIEPHPLYQLWASMTFHSQNLLWSSVEATTTRTGPAKAAAAERLAANPDKRGAMSLSDTVVAPPPISTVEIHRQPGGYTRERFDGDIHQALTYAGSIELYRNAKGMGTGAKSGADDMGRFVAQTALTYAPDLAPTSIVDMGCGTGEQTLAYKRVFPDAKVTGIDCARPFVRYAHALAESAGLAVDFAHRDAADTGLPDASVDLIVSIIMFHETSAAQIGRILRESWRLVRPGGLVLHMDVPYQPSRMPLVKQVTNNWQVLHNGEPFWSGFVNADMKSELLAAGFDPDGLICGYESVGPATYFFFGGRKA